jgi:hypothetical protein
MNPSPLPNDTVLLGQQLVIYAQSHRIRKDTWLDALDTFQNWYPQTKPASADDALQHRLAKNRGGALVPAFERLIGAIQQQQRQQDAQQRDDGDYDDTDDTDDDKSEHQGDDQGHTTDDDTGNTTQDQNATLPYMSPMAYVWHKNPLYALIRSYSAHNA